MIFFSTVVFVFPAAVQLDNDWCLIEVVKKEKSVFIGDSDHLLFGGISLLYRKRAKITIRN